MVVKQVGTEVGPIRVRVRPEQTSDTQILAPEWVFISQALVQRPRPKAGPLKP